MKPFFRYCSLFAAAHVVGRGSYLVCRSLSGQGFPGHDQALGAFMDYLVYFGLVAAVGLGLGIAGRTRLGIIGNLAQLIFVAILYVID